MSKVYTREEREELRRLHAATTSGEWTSCRDNIGALIDAGVYGGDSCKGLRIATAVSPTREMRSHRNANMKFIATAHNAFPSLLAQIDDLEKLLELYGETENPITVCPDCDGTTIPKPPKQAYCCPIGHAKKCACLLCGWRNNGYCKAEQIRELEKRLEAAERDTARALDHIGKIALEVVGGE